MCYQNAILEIEFKVYSLDLWVKKNISLSTVASSTFRNRKPEFFQVMFGTGHTSNVRVLYKSILRLHRGLPLELKALGDQYVKDEFKRHIDCDPKFVPAFMKEWTVC